MYVIPVSYFVYKTMYILKTYLIEVSCIQPRNMKTFAPLVYPRCKTLWVCARTAKDSSCRRKDSDLQPKNICVRQYKLYVLKNIAITPSF